MVEVPPYNSPSTACGESFAPFLADEVDIDDEDDEDDDDDDAGRRSDSDCRRRSPPPPFLLPPPPLAPAPPPALPYLTASMKGFPTPVTLFAVR